MRLLILGGTRFLGRHLVEAAQARGHEVTLFNRGQTNPNLFPELPQLRGDRQGDLAALKDGDWDAVIDPSGYTPSAVKASAKILSGRADHYTFISTVSAYREPLFSGLDESAPLHSPPEDDTVPVGPETYGPLKAGAEAALQQAFDGTSLVIRPGLISADIPFNAAIDRFPTVKLFWTPSSLMTAGSKAELSR